MSNHEFRPPGQKRSKTVYIGTFIQCKTLQELDVWIDATIGVDELGLIRFMDRDASDLDALLKRHNWLVEHCSVVRASSSQFFFPGFIDTHIHAPQYPNVGIFGNSTLLEWLNKYTFPLESSLKDVRKAKTVYSRCVRRTLSNGTTTAAYFATIHAQSTNLLADICLGVGQRAFIGRCCMDRNGPAYYLDASAEAALSETRATIEHIKGIDPDHELISPIITPRFAVSCTEDYLRRLGQLHRETALPIQTHISETKSECDLVRRLFPESSSYASVYDAYGLLTSKTILAHAVHLTDDERDLIRERDAKIAHCPTSNTALASGAARVRWLLDGGLTVGLGTDVSGGYSPSMLESARQACLVSRHVAMSESGGGGGGDGGNKNNNHAKLSVNEVLYLATKGGAAVVGLSDAIGGFQVGMRWDAQLIEMGPVVGADEGDADDAMDENPVDVFAWEEEEDHPQERQQMWEHKIAKWLFNGDDRNTLAVWVNGKLVHRRRSWKNQ